MLWMKVTKFYMILFSIYLSNDGKTPGDITFGGYNLKKYAKPDEKI